jgi:hypothetical protein
MLVSTAPWAAAGWALARVLCVSGTVAPPRAQAVPIRTNWNVRIEAIDAQGHAQQTWHARADSKGRFACNLALQR